MCFVKQKKTFDEFSMETMAIYKIIISYLFLFKCKENEMKRNKTKKNRTGASKRARAKKSIDKTVNFQQRHQINV